MSMTHKIQDFPFMAPPEGSISLASIVAAYCEKDGLVRHLDSIYAPAPAGQKQGARACSISDYWPRICTDLKAERLAWAARLTPASASWSPLSGALAELYEISNIDLGVLKGPDGSIVYEARFLWINSADGPSSEPATREDEKKDTPGRLRVDWSSAVQEVILKSLERGLPTGKGKLVRQIIAENEKRLEDAGLPDRGGSDTSATDFLKGEWLNSAKADPRVYAQAYADLLAAIYDAAGRKTRIPGTSMKKAPL